MNKINNLNLDNAATLFIEYVQQQLNEFQNILQETDTIYQIIFVFIVILISYYCGNKQAQRSILIDKKLKTQILDAENKKRKLRKTYIQMDQYHKYVLTWIFMFYIFAVLIIIAHVATYFFMTSLFYFMIKQYIYLILGSIALFISLHSFKLYCIYQKKKINAILQKEEQQEISVEKTIINKLGVLLISKIKQSILKDDAIQMEKEKQNFQKLMKESEDRYNKLVLLTNKEKNNLNSQIQELEKSSHQISKKYQTQIQFQEQQIVELKKQFQAHCVMKQDSPQNSQEELTEEQKKTQTKCVNVYCINQKQFLDNSLKNSEQFITKLTKFEWCDVCKQQYSSNKIEDEEEKLQEFISGTQKQEDKSEDDEFQQVKSRKQEINETKDEKETSQPQQSNPVNNPVICQEKCLQKYFEFCKQLGSEYIVNQQNIKRENQKVKQTGNSGIIIS